MPGLQFGTFYNDLYQEDVKLYVVSQHDTQVQSFCYIYLEGWLTALSYPFDFSIILFAIGLEITLSGLIVLATQGQELN